jgi:hypothetical protein
MNTPVQKLLYIQTSGTETPERFHAHFTRVRVPVNVVGAAILEDRLLETDAVLSY